MNAICCDRGWKLINYMFHYDDWVDLDRLIWSFHRDRRNVAMLLFLFLPRITVSEGPPVSCTAESVKLCFSLLYVLIGRRWGQNRACWNFKRVKWGLQWSSFKGKTFLSIFYMSGPTLPDPKACLLLPSLGLPPEIFANTIAEGEGCLPAAGTDPFSVLTDSWPFKKFPVCSIFIWEFLCLEIIIPEFLQLWRTLIKGCNLHYSPYLP